VLLSAPLPIALSTTITIPFPELLARRRRSTLPSKQLRYLLKVGFFVGRRSVVVRWFLVRRGSFGGRKERRRRGRRDVGGAEQGLR